MAFCGCTLRSSTASAAIISILNFLFFVPIDVTIILAIKWPTFLRTERAGWNHFVNGFAELDSTNVLLPLVCVRLSLHALWLITIPYVFIGNSTNRRTHLLPWEYFAIIKFLYMLATTTYFVVTHSSCGFLHSISFWLKDHWYSPDKNSGQQMARFVTFLDLADGGPLFWVILILLTCCVHIRGLQIKYQKRADTVFTPADVQLVPIHIPRAKLCSTNDLSKDGFDNRPESGSIHCYDNFGYQQTYRKY